jgi:hypothetical protein
VALSSEENETISTCLKSTCMVKGISWLLGLGVPGYKTRERATRTPCHAIGAALTTRKILPGFLTAREAGR